jgi:hypothetical protein
LNVHSVTPDEHMTGEPSLTQVHPSSALAGDPVSSAPPMSSPAAIIILRMESSLLEERYHYATRAPQFQGSQRAKTAGFAGSKPNLLLRCS